ncbi:histidinol phosphate phosphatase [Sulfurovum lithotrophicum]|uniref:Histidinol-phosphatase n=1 Tax=Sulfurovum lithotrophicum TaxID=206403 RepID=A0A7U4M2A4_9BACT|nr:histidinol-phosphatase [Sulfurovum lithotrophicum]AKF25568.1 histidinol phosphate phosphatase [Sulfurovum lithotrophicum]
MNKRTRIDLHNHTARCNHAEGTIDEYIQKAIDLGIDIYGFSEHAPMDFDEKYRLPLCDMDAYVNDVLSAKERYKDQIKILLGYEVDWLPGHMEKNVLNADVDYLIGSVHFIDKWSFDNPEFIGGWKNRDIDEIWQAYFEATKAMADSGKFDIVGHLDLIKVFKYLPKTDTRILAKEALQSIKKSKMVIELNTAGLRKPIGEIYPSKALLQEAYALDIPITFSSDAHSVEQVGFAYEKAVALAKEIGYTKAVTFEGRDRELVIF